jgi:hypothetical protein
MVMDDAFADVAGCNDIDANEDEASRVHGDSALTNSTRAEESMSFNGAR